MSSKLRYIAFVTIFLVYGCSQREPQPVVSHEMNSVKLQAEAYQNELKRQKEIRKKIEEIKAAKNNKKAVKKEPRFDVRTDNLPVNLFFMNLMQGAEANIVVHPDVGGSITLNLNQVTLSEVLNVIRDVYGFDYKYKNNIYTILPKSLRTEIFPINYIDVKRVGVSDTSVLTGNIESSAQSGSQASNQVTNLTGEGGEINPGSRIQTRSETDFWKSLNAALSQLIGVSDQTTQNNRRVITNPQTGVAIVTAMPKELEAVRNFLEKARLSVKRQVIIEAKILEIQLSDSYQAGVNWNEINGQLLIGKNASDFDTSVTINEISEGVGEVFSSLVRISDIGRLLSLLETQGNLQVLSSPRVSTVNNQKAVIRVGSDQFFVTGISSSTISNASSTTSSPDIELSSFFSGISLDVTPQISDDGGVILHIHPVVSTVTEEQKNIIVGNESFSLPLALRDIRESDSIVKAESGQVIVLGGLMQERINNTKGKRPGLGDIPVVSKAFKTRSDSRIKSELIILLKPIVIEQDSWIDDIQQSQSRFESLSLKDVAKPAAEQKQ